MRFYDCEVQKIDILSYSAQRIGACLLTPWVTLQSSTNRRVVWPFLLLLSDTVFKYQIARSLLIIILFPNYCLKRTKVSPSWLVESRHALVQ
ncbi:hypothetical protein QFZ34_002940 [Phyllobacterium ifriqiyense]|uniref:Uncharacterized protein n=1 Tax=Phyllobacterium ifriqiyense TaxID=314238 RepID=A0ABU0SAH0_9HYPH|nr:hypothetical protein [Phyllobacterium ifriqiyense]